MNLYKDKTNHVDASTKVNRVCVHLQRSGDWLCGVQFFQRVGVAGRTAHRDSHSSEERWEDCSNLGRKERDAETGVNEKPASFFRLCSDDFFPPTLKKRNFLSLREQATSMQLYLPGIVEKSDPALVVSLATMDIT
ncbi:hypothetical protein RRG08_061685 [Elysia crispata]|uniref:Uncharacterized protein n=1 Tax=Elysia crispata TaxID=231223 RepID=A0AAE1AW50_9GAST|nr:hypothetical protein RRG08_061685 [Elysia crispata]